MPTPLVLIDSAPAMHACTRTWQRDGCTVGLVPTMGYLHRGHLSLVEACRQRCDRTVVSIFVNPLQFGPQEDYSVYPRDLARDLHLLEPLGVDVVFHPDAGAYYAADHTTFVEVTGLTTGLCGAARPGHFRGVTTVVAKLFNTIRPDVAVFGHKDYQQATVIRRMVRDLDMGIEIVVAPTVREADGLAMSSRNSRLTPADRQRAPAIYRALEAARRQIASGALTDAGQVSRQIRAQIAAELSPEIDYVEVVDPETLAPVTSIAAPVVMAVAVRVPGVRLIDNLRADPPAGRPAAAR